MSDGEPSDYNGTVASQVQATNEDRASLVMRARQFLLSPQVQNEDESAKRRFLQEKGLSESEVALLLQEQVRRVSRLHFRACVVDLGTC